MTFVHAIHWTFLSQLCQLTRNSAGCIVFCLDIENDHGQSDGRGRNDSPSPLAACTKPDRRPPTIVRQRRRFIPGADRRLGAGRAVALAIRDVRVIRASINSHRVPLARLGAASRAPPRAGAAGRRARCPADFDCRFAGACFGIIVVLCASLWYCAC